MTYVYDASGNKLRKVSSTEGTRDYIGGIEYNGTTIELIHTEEGIARRNGTSYSYEYNLKDHLGNVRASFYKNPNGGLEELQRDDYYAFGLRKNNKLTSSNNKYLYNGKDLQQELGQYDYGARFYDPVIGRWNVIDPMAEKHTGITPYNYVINNPLSYIDPFGLDTSRAGSTEKIKPLDIIIADDGKQIVSALSEVSVSKKINCPTCPDPSTVGKNIGGGTYAGGRNPLDFNGDYTYAVTPTKPWDPSGIGHDRRYDNLRATGALSLLTDTRTIGADWLFVKEELEVAYSRNITVSNSEKAKAYWIGVGLGAIALPKTIHKLNTPGGMSMIMMWFKKSDKGVTNEPSKF